MLDKSLLETIQPLSIGYVLQVKGEDGYMVYRVPHR